MVTGTCWKMPKTLALPCHFMSKSSLPQALGPMLLDLLTAVQLALAAEACTQHLAWRMQEMEQAI